MNILVISSYLPHPLFSGGHIRLYNLLKYLSKRHTITLICEKRDSQTQEDVEAIKKICKKVIAVKRKKQWSFSNIFTTMTSTKPFLIVGHTNSELRERIKKELSESIYDLIHVETFYIMQNLPLTTISVILAEQNIEYLVYKRFVNRLSIFLRPFFNLDIIKLKKNEEYYWKKATKLIAVSDQEKNLMTRKDIEVIPNGVDVDKFKVKSEELKINRNENRLLFIGDFKWIQNRDSAEWIIKEIWPLIKLKVKNENLKVNLRLWIVGKNIPEKIKSLSSDQDIIFDENAPKETEKIFQESFILLAPIRVGGGTNYKILEAMSCGVPVITTELGAEGIKAKKDQEIMLADTSENLASIVLTLYQDAAKYEKIAKQARKLVEDNYNWQIIGRKLEAVYKSVVEL